MHLLQRRVGLERLLNRREVAIHQRTEIRQRALRVHERDRQRRALERAERPFLAVLIDELRVGHRLAGFEELERRTTSTAWSVAGFSSGASPTFFTVAEVRARSIDDERGVDQIARRDAVQQLRILHLVRHRHRRHEAFDLFVLDGGLLMIGRDREHLALQRDRCAGRMASCRTRPRPAPGRGEKAM